MKFVMFVLPIVVALSACSGSSPTGSSGASTTSSTTSSTTVPTPVSPTDALRSKLTALSPTATMPTGNATYTGKFFATNSTPSTVVPGLRITTKYDSDLNLAANFDTRRVTTTLSNTSAVLTSNLSSTVGLVKLSGTATGTGTIAGNTISLGTITGIVTPVSYTIDGVAQTLPNAGSYTVRSATNVNFVGPNADGIYQKGTATVDGIANTATEILATRN